jgi:hypothetical protein
MLHGVIIACRCRRSARAIGHLSLGREDGEPEETQYDGATNLFHQRLSRQNPDHIHMASGGPCNVHINCCRKLGNIVMSLELIAAGMSLFLAQSGQFSALHQCEPKCVLGALRNSERL